MVEVIFRALVALAMGFTGQLKVNRFFVKCHLTYALDYRITDHRYRTVELDFDRRNAQYVVEHGIVVL